MQDDAQQTIFFNNTQVDPHTKFTYDALYRLLSATGRQMVGLSAPTSTDVGIQSLPDATATALELYTQSYQYDEMGNILQMAHAANSGNWNKYFHYTSGFTNNYLLSTSPDNTQPGTDHYTYDAHGNMTAMPHLASMSWDYADRMQSADLGGGGDVYYTYDAGGNRVRKVVENGSTLEERVYLGDYEVYRKTVSGSLDTERETLHISDDTGQIALADTLTVDSGSTVSTPTINLRYQMSNHLGSATLELDHNAAIISYEEYYPFGSTSYRSGRNNAETSLKRYRYVGKERDDETGLYYYGARYYASWLARFVSVDPLKDDYPQLTPYQYASNDPVGDVDIDGLQSAKTKPNKNHPKPITNVVERMTEEGFKIRTTTVTIGEDVTTTKEVLANNQVLQGKEEYGVVYKSPPSSKPKSSNTQKDILEFINSIQATEPTDALILSDADAERIKNRLTQEEKNIRDFGQLLSPNTKMISLPEVQRNDFTFTIITGDLGLGGGVTGNIAFIEFSEELTNIYAGKSGIISGGGIGFDVGLQFGLGTGYGNFTEELDPYENPLQKIANASTFETGLTLPVYGGFGSGGASITGFEGSNEVFRAMYFNTSYGASLRKIDPILDMLPFPTIQNSIFGTSLKDLEIPTKEDTSRIKEVLRLRNE